MNSKCCSSTSETLIFAGAAHCGQVANRAAIELTKQGKGQMFCLAAVAAEIPDKIERARKAALHVAIDGCEDHCTRKTLDKAGVPADAHIESTVMGVEKKPATHRLIEDARKVAERVSQLIAARSDATASVHRGVPSND